MRGLYALGGLSFAAVAAVVLMVIPSEQVLAVSQDKPDTSQTRTSSFVLPAHDGYGISECLQAGGECAQTVANSWCKTQGFHNALSYGVLSDEDITATIKASSASSSAHKPYQVTCGQ
jgi:hypothetical protein